MEIVITARHTEVPERFRRLVEERLAKVPSLAPKAQRADVELSHESNPRQSSTCDRVEITLRGKGPVVRAEACSEDCAAALDLAFAKLLERLRRSRDRHKVHHGRQTPPSVRVAPPPLPDGPALPGPSRADRDADADSYAGARGAAGDTSAEGDGFDGSPVVIRTKDHAAPPMTLEQALYEMELVGHDFFLYVDAGTGCPSVVYRRRGWSYGVIRLQPDRGAELAGAHQG